NNPEKPSLTVLLDEISAAGMDSHLCRRQTKDQPIVTKIHRGPFQNVAKESAISVRVFAVEKEMRSVDHDGSLEDQQHRGKKSGAKRRYVRLIPLPMRQAFSWSNGQPR